MENYSYCESLNIYFPSSLITEVENILSEILILANFNNYVVDFKKNKDDRSYTSLIIFPPLTKKHWALFFYYDKHLVINNMYLYIKDDHQHTHEYTNKTSQFTTFMERIASLL